jgi:protoporphyrinogen oxidase
VSRIVVLGCGWSGLLASIRVKSLFPSADVICLDKNFEGGLLHTKVVNGYLFDTGGSHVFFSTRRDVIDGVLSMGGEWVARERAAYVLLDGFLVPYPFENGIYVLPPEKRGRYGTSLVKALAEYRDERPKNFKEWILRTFGHEVAEDYLIPYNEKIWKRPLEQLSADWVHMPGRLPLPSLEDIVKAVAGLPTVGYKEQARFYYPRRGGIVKQWEVAYERAKSLGVEFLRVEVREVKALLGEYVVNGWLRADRVINTLPLKEAPSIFGLSEEAFKAAEKLDYNSVVVVGLGLKHPAPRQHWVYVPDKHVAFHRYAWISNYGEDALSNRSAMIAEVTVPPMQEVDLGELKARLFRDLVEIGVIREGEVEVVEAWYNKYGYPIHTLTHASDVATITQNLAKIGVLTFGRWGNWQYWNTDKIYEKAYDMEV